MLFLLTQLLVACGEDKKIAVSEKQVAMNFFDAIYNKKDIKQAMALSSKRFRQDVKKYKTASNFARRLLRLQFNSVKMTTAAQKTQIIDEYNTQVTMTVVFTGKRQENIYKDYKKIRLIKENHAWVVDKILKDS